MAKEILAVYDPCQLYIERFLCYADTRINWNVEIKGFTDLTILADYLQNHKIKAVLFSQESALENTAWNHGEEFLMYRLDGVRILVLGEQPDADDDRLPEEWKGKEQVHWIYKYQSARNILAEIRAILEEPAALSCPMPLQGFQLSGLYSPADKISHPKAAQAIKERIGRGEKNQILYVNLEQFSGMGELLEHSANGNLSDVLYSYVTNPSRLAETLNRVKGRYQGMDVLIAPEHLEDMEVIGKEGWPDFLGTIARTGDYQHIIIDLTFFCFELIDVILGCGTLYIPAMPYPESRTYRSVLYHRTESHQWKQDSVPAKMREFRQYFLNMGREEDLNKILEVRVDVDG